MAHAIRCGANGRRREVDFEGVEITVEVFFVDETVEIAVEAPQDLAPSETGAKGLRLCGGCA